MILNADRAVVAYEGVFFGEDAEHDSVPALSRSPFVRVNLTKLDLTQLEALNPSRHVLEVRKESGVVDLGSFAEQVRACRQKGFKLALDAELLDAELSGLSLEASYRVLNGKRQPFEAVALEACAPPALIFARNVSTTLEFEQLKLAGVTLFAGDWYVAQPSKTGAVLPLSVSVLIRLLDLVAREADVVEVEELLRLEPTLAYRLLRYINSAGFGLRSEITSLRHAINTIGLKPLFGWTTMLIAGEAPGNVAPAVAVLAVARARTMELIALEQAGRRVLTWIRMRNVLLVGCFAGHEHEGSARERGLPKELADALLEEKGPYADFLKLAKACDLSECPNYADAASYAVSKKYLGRVRTEALSWLEQVGT